VVVVVLALVLVLVLVLFAGNCLLVAAGWGS
jgi:hypothetical protein